MSQHDDYISAQSLKEASFRHQFVVAFEAAHIGTILHFHSQHESYVMTAVQRSVCVCVCVNNIIVTILQPT